MKPTETIVSTAHAATLKRNWPPFDGFQQVSALRSQFCRRYRSSPPLKADTSASGSERQQCGRDRRQRGAESTCGWCKNRCWHSWQITPRLLLELTTSADRDKVKSAFEAMMTIMKIDIAALKAAVNK